MLLLLLYKCLEYLWGINKKLVVAIASGEENWMAEVKPGENLFTLFEVFLKTFI